VEYQLKVHLHLCFQQNTLLLRVVEQVAAANIQLAAAPADIYLALLLMCIPKHIVLLLALAVELIHQVPILRQHPVELLQLLQLAAAAEGIIQHQLTAVLVVLAVAELLEALLLVLAAPALLVHLDRVIMEVVLHKHLVTQPVAAVVPAQQEAQCLVLVAHAAVVPAVLDY
jgi:hypothetical protein